MPGGEEELRPPPLLVDAEEARGEDLRVVEDEEVSRPQQAGQVRDEAVRDVSRRPAESHQAGRPAGCGALGDGLGRKEEVEVGDPHGAILSRPGAHRE